MCNDYRSEGNSAKSDLIGLERGIPISMLKALSSPPPNAAKRGSPHKRYSTLGERNDHYSNRGRLPAGRQHR